MCIRDRRWMALDRAMWVCNNAWCLFLTATSFLVNKDEYVSCEDNSMLLSWHDLNEPRESTERRSAGFHTVGTNTEKARGAKIEVNCCFWKYVSRWWRQLPGLMVAHLAAAAAVCVSCSTVIESLTRHRPEKPSVWYHNHEPLPTLG